MLPDSAPLLSVLFARTEPDIMSAQLSRSARDTMPSGILMPGGMPIFNHAGQATMPCALPCRMMSAQAEPVGSQARSRRCAVRCTVLIVAALRCAKPAPKCNAQVS
jgi:hypothetical protein